MSAVGSVGSSLGNTIEKSKKRDIASCKWCFTFNNYCPEDIDTLVSKFEGSAKYVFQEETGESGTPHLQGAVQFKKKCRPVECIGIKSIHWEKCKNWEASIAYCTKSDSRTGAIFSNLRFEKPLKLITEFRKWQQDILDIIAKGPDDRSIYWFWDYDGNIGKSVFCKYLCATMGALSVAGRGNDCKYGIIKYKEIEGVYPEIIIYDIPRTALDYVNYEALESIKNGLFFCGKYESSQVIMNCPFIFCFANAEPDLTKLSADRWIVKQL